MDGLSKRHTACQTAMEYEPVIAKIDTATSVDETILQPDEEAFDSYSNIDEAATLHPPESTATKININPFTNPFFDDFDDLITLGTLDAKADKMK
ncbi:hypothetical protein HNY73_014462 [Argiope bruennichi]|uniref:Uncharacterized protein n=1 Tax=Argiope bruennichi TaxID=94029 RepID=A0A8T0EP03_ARGBR|nr:hypothetical protein HNY73_014462 [Argiope bruennichi]